MMENLVKVIHDTIREVYRDNDYLSDIDLAYIFLRGIARRTLQGLKEDFTGSVKEGMQFYLQNLRPKDPIYKDRKITNQLINELTVRTLELLDHMMELSNGDVDEIILELIEDHDLIQASYYAFSEVMIEKNTGTQSVFYGQIRNVVRRTSGKKKFAYLTVVDHKDKEITLQVSSTFYNQYEDDLKDCKGRYLGFTGKIAFDKYLNTLIVQAYELDIVKGYHIPRVPIKLNNLTNNRHDK